VVQLCEPMSASISEPGVPLVRGILDLGFNLISQIPQHIGEKVDVLHRIPRLVHREASESEIRRDLRDDSLPDFSPLIVLIQNHVKRVKNVFLKVDFF
jgi:hypothetical protein